MFAQTKDLWSLATNQQQIDPADLAEAVESQVRSGDLDYRTRVLIRDSISALRSYWGNQQLSAWLQINPVGSRIESICEGPFDDDRGFYSLMRRVVTVTKPETIEQFFRELGSHLQRGVRVDVGGSVSLILRGHLSRKTEDVDVVDEVPPELRSQHKLLHELAARYDLELTHFQRRYLPMAWEQRLHSLPPFGRLQVYLIDVYDVFLSKLYSAREKDLDDLRVLAPQLDKAVLVQMLKDTTQSMLAALGLREKAQKNWYILYGEDLPA